MGAMGHAVPTMIGVAIDLINQQEFDILLFTGDIVNNFHWEMDKWYDVFSKIKQAPHGNFAVLGNHDYGEYSDWKTEEGQFSFSVSHYFY